MSGFPDTRRLLAAALSSALLCAAPAARPAGAVTRPASDPSCSWGGEVSVDEHNALFPESHAAYWATAFTVHPDLRIGLSGAFPDSRFASLTVYRGEGGAFSVNGVDSTLTDYEIAPDPGTSNPWQPEPYQPHQPHQPHRLHRPAGTYTADMVLDPSPGAVNTLPLAPAGTADGTLGRLIYRVYLPAGGDFGAVPLPQLTLYRDGGSTTLPVCDDDGGTTVLAGEPAARPADEPADISFVRPPAEFGLLPNTDSGYVAATVTPPAGDQVLVIRGRGARSAHGDHPSVWPRHDLDLRYWSMCTNLDNAQRSLVVNPLPDGSTDYGCRDDDETVLDASGYYTFVVGTEAQRAAIEQIPGVTFVPWSAARPHAQHLIFLRNMLANRGFGPAIQNVTADQDPATAQAVMGEYYPRDAICPLATVETAGAGACLDGS